MNLNKYVKGAKIKITSDVTSTDGKFHIKKGSTTYIEGVTKSGEIMCSIGDVDWQLGKIWLDVIEDAPAVTVTTVGKQSTIYGYYDDDGVWTSGPQPTIRVKE